MNRLRMLLSSALALIIALAAATSALALVDLAAVASSDVSVDNGAGLSSISRSRLESTAASLASQGTPVKFVVLRTKPTDAQGYADSIRRKLAFGGDVFVLSPNNLRISSPLRTADVQRAFDAERPTLRENPVAGTIAIANRLSAIRTGGGASGGQSGSGGSSDSGGNGGGGGALLGILLLGGGVVAVGALVARRRAKARTAGAGGLQRESLDPLVDALAAQIGDLDDDMQIAGERTTAAKPHYDVAVLSYGEARDALASVSQTSTTVQIAGAALEKGLRAARRTRAVLEGRPPEEADNEPLLEGLCSFDPKHGKATTTVTITTPSGEKAELPACAKCAADMAAGTEPRFREVEHRGQMVPYWQSRGMGPGMGRGGGVGPILGGALAGMILGGMFGGGNADASGQDNFGGGGGGGDFGGGGGGDFGGGGGGGDFGGGGGGDF